MMKCLTTLCYIEKDGQYLMLHRTKKEHDINKDKWIGIGGHFEVDESPDECLRREVFEETGCTLGSCTLRGVVTFVSDGRAPGAGVTEYMFLYTAEDLQGEPADCDEGELVWVNKEECPDLNVWEGDKIFFRLLNTHPEFFSLKLVYDGGDRLMYAALDGRPLEL